MTIPNTSGLRLKEATEQLGAAGYESITVVVTAPPKERLFDYDDRFRVIRQKDDGEKNITLLVARPYEARWI